MSLLWQECADVEILNFTVYLYIFPWSFWHLRGTHLADVKFHWVLMQKPFSFRWKNICFLEVAMKWKTINIAFFFWEDGKKYDDTFWYTCCLLASFMHHYRMQYNTKRQQACSSVHGRVEGKSVCLIVWEIQSAFCCLCPPTALQS